MRGLAPRFLKLCRIVPMPVPNYSVRWWYSEYNDNLRLMVNVPLTAQSTTKNLKQVSKECMVWGSLPISFCLDYIRCRRQVALAGGIERAPNHGITA